MPTNAELVSLLPRTEDQFVERKSVSDKGGWLETIVAFANSNPIGFPSVLFMGVDNEGKIMNGMKVEEALKSVAVPWRDLQRTLGHVQGIALAFKF
jgi:predicted HTH transcriptional regulator